VKPHAYMPIAVAIAMSELVGIPGRATADTQLPNEENVQGLLTLCAIKENTDVKANLVGAINLWRNDKLSGNANISIQTYLDKIPDSQKLDAYKLYMTCVKPYVDSLGTKQAQRNQIIDKFNQVLEQINLTINEKESRLIPAINDYQSNPTKARWNEVVERAHGLLDQIEAAVKLSTQYDAQFTNVGERIILIADSTRQTVVDRQLVGQFKVSQRVWNGHAFELREIIETRDGLPDPQQVSAWQADLTQQVEALRTEVERLVTEIQEKI
jgi:hypothetical protein